MLAFQNMPGVDRHVSGPFLPEGVLNERQRSTHFPLNCPFLLDHVGQTVNTAIFEAARAPKKSSFTSIMDKRVKPFKPVAYEQLMQREHATWTHYASAQDTAILDQVTSNAAESTMHMVGAWVVSVAVSDLSVSQVSDARNIRPYTLYT